jgi:hypothetical protein
MIKEPAAEIIRLHDKQYLLVQKVATSLAARPQNQQYDPILC